MCVCTLCAVVRGGPAAGAGAAKRQRPRTAGVVVDLRRPCGRRRRGRVGARPEEKDLEHVAVPGRPASPDRGGVRPVAGRPPTHQLGAVVAPVTARHAAAAAAAAGLPRPVSRRAAGRPTSVL